MNTKNTLLIFAGLFASVQFFSCSKDSNEIEINEVQTSVKAPEGIEEYTLEDVVVTFTEVNTGIITKKTINSTNKTAVSKVASINVGTINNSGTNNNVVKLSSTGSQSLNDLASNLPTGSYNITLEGKIKYFKDGQEITSKVKGYKSGVVLSSTNREIELDLFISDETASLILKEIYFTGSITPEGKQYNGDKYFIIYNNSDETLYADSLIISEAGFLSTTKREYIPDVMNEAFTAGSIIMVPGTGKQYPILPGKQIVIANNAINHLEYNANSIDLRDADFEIELLSSINVDNPEVTNMISLNGAMTMHNRGFKSYVLARLPKGMTIDEYKTEQRYTYGYLNAAGNLTNSSAYKIPNSYIIDAVNLSVAAKFEWILTSPQLDMGWTYCGKVDSDATRYGKSVIRKVLTTNPDGRVIYQDTNNSTVDFIAEATPSLQK